MEGKKIIAADYATGQAHLTTSEGKCCLEGTSYFPNVGSRNFHFHINNPIRSSSQPNPFFITVSIDDALRLAQTSGRESGLSCPNAMEIVEVGDDVKEG
jgi:hypothetical protein